MIWRWHALTRMKLDTTFNGTGKLTIVPEAQFDRLYDVVLDDREASSQRGASTM